MGVYTALDVLLDRLEHIRREYGRDPEHAHAEADEALLKYINDPEVRAAYDAIEKWYA